MAATARRKQGAIYTHIVNDRVRLKDGSLTGQRGIITSVDQASLGVMLNATGEIVYVAADAVQNYSLAARKAWKTTPKRKGIGGRHPRKDRPRPAVAFRLDPFVWDLLEEAARRGLISNRTEAINQWILAGVTTLLRDESPVEAVPAAPPCSSNIIALTSRGR